MAKEKLTIEQKLRKRKYHIPKTPVWWAYHCLAKMPFFEPKYNVSYEIIDDPRKCEGPCFIIWNHQSRRDYLFLKAALKSKKFNMVAGYSEFSRKKFSTLFNLAQVLPKKNFCSDPIGIKAITSIIKQGGCVTFSPEGTSSVYGCNQPIVAGTGRLLQFFNVPVYLMHLEGAYLTSHKVDISDRVGKVNVKISLLFAKDELKGMKPQEIDDKINLAFKHDDYEWNKTARVKYKTKGKQCDRLDDLLYKCPKCGKEHVIKSGEGKIECTACGNGATMNEYYDFIPFNNECVVPVSPSAWMAYQRIEMIKDIRKNPDYSFTTHVKIGDLPKYTPIKDNNIISLPCGEGDITFDHQGIHFVGVRHGEEYKFDTNYDVFYTLLNEAECDNFAMYLDGEMIVFYPNDKSVGKCMMITEEMHRLHFNTWKNFPWNAFMYHGTELEVENDNYEEEMKKLFL